MALITFAVRNSNPWIGSFTVGSPQQRNTQWKINCQVMPLIFFNARNRPWVPKLSNPWAMAAT